MTNQPPAAKVTGASVQRECKLGDTIWYKDNYAVAGIIDRALATARAEGRAEGFQVGNSEMREWAAINAEMRGPLTARMIRALENSPKESRFHPDPIEREE